MRCVVDILHTAKHYKRKQNKHQEERHAHQSLRRLPRTDKNDAHGGQFQCEQMQAVERRKAFFYTDTNVFQRFVGTAKALGRCPFLPKGLHDGKSANVFDRCTRHIFHGFMSGRSSFFAVAADPV